MTKENKLQTECIKYLKSEGIYCLNVHGGGWGGKGAPDLITCINGKFVAFELKVEKNEKQTGQKIHEKRIIKNKGKHFSPRSLKDFVEIIRYLQEDTSCD